MSEQENFPEKNYSLDYIYACFELIKNEDEGLETWLALMEASIDEWDFSYGKKLLSIIKRFPLSSYALAQISLISGDFYEKMGARDKANLAYQKTIESFQRLEEKDSEAIAINNLALSLVEGQKYPEAEELYKKTIAIYKELNDTESAGHIFANLGNLSEQQGKWLDAISYYEQGLSLLKKVNEKRGLARLYNNLGTIYENLGNLEQAESHFMQSLDLLDDLELAYSESGIRILVNLGQLYAKKENWEKAISSHQSALKICQETGDYYSEATTHNNLGALYYAKKEYSQAVKAFQKSAEIHQKIKNYQGLSLALSNLGGAYFEVGKIDLAKTSFQNSLLISDEFDNPSRKARLYNNLGTLSESQEEYEEAIGYYEKSIRIFKELEENHREVLGIINLCSIYNKRAQPTAYRKILDRAWQISTRQKYTDHLFILCLIEGDAEFIQGDDIRAGFHWYAKASQYAREDETCPVDKLIMQIEYQFAHPFKSKMAKEKEEYSRILLDVWDTPELSKRSPKFWHYLQSFISLG